MWRTLKTRYYQMKGAGRLIRLAMALGHGLKGNAKMPHGWMGLGVRLLSLYYKTRKR